MEWRALHCCFCHAGVGRHPLWRIQESSDLLYRLCTLNPFTYAVELIRYALYLKTNGAAAAVVVGVFVVFSALAVYAYDDGPRRTGHNAPVESQPGGDAFCP